MDFRFLPIIETKVALAAMLRYFQGRCKVHRQHSTLGLMFRKSPPAQKDARETIVSFQDLRFVKHQIPLLGSRYSLVQFFQ